MVTSLDVRSQFSERPAVKKPHRSAAAALETVINVYVLLVVVLIP